jgi:Protein kinase domain
MEGKQLVVLPRMRAPSMIVGMGSSAGSLVPLGARSFGNYELLARLATGGMAEIFLARPRQSTAASSVLVIKRVLPHLAEDARFVAMFRDEARLAAQIEHDNVCRVLDLGSVGDTYFIAMEYLHGMPLSRVLVRAARSGQPLDFRLVAGLLVQCCAGLHHAHELRGVEGHSLEVVHRDISPPNIFVTADGVVKLLDFGVAKAQGASEKTRTGTVKGKNAYMSPEQVLGQPMDRRSDIFSLGIVLWEALTAQRLFMREVDFETFRAITEGEVPDVRMVRPDTPSELAEVVLRALAIDPQHRFATALELGDAIAAAVVGLGGPCGDREISAFLAERFATELRARVQLLHATGADADAPVGADDPTVVRGQGPSPSGVAGAIRDAVKESVEIRWTPSRKTGSMRRITTGSIPQLDGRPRVVMPLPAPQPESRTVSGSMSIPDPGPGSGSVIPSWASGAGPGTGMSAGPGNGGTGTTSVTRVPKRQIITSRVKPLPAPLRSPELPEEAENSHHQAAAVLFAAGVFGLLVLLWWLL